MAHPEPLTVASLRLDNLAASTVSTVWVRTLTVRVTTAPWRSLLVALGIACVITSAVS